MVCSINVQICTVRFRTKRAAPSVWRQSSSVPCQNTSVTAYWDVKQAKAWRDLLRSPHCLTVWWCRRRSGRALCRFWTPSRLFVYCSRESDAFSHRERDCPHKSQLMNVFKEFSRFYLNTLLVIIREDALVLLLVHVQVWLCFHVVLYNYSQLIRFYSFS